MRILVVSGYNLGGAYVHHILAQGRRFRHAHACPGAGTSVDIGVEDGCLIVPSGPPSYWLRELPAQCSEDAVREPVMRDVLARLAAIPAQTLPGRP